VRALDGTAMKLEHVIRGIAISDRRGCFETEVEGLTADSRQVRDGDVYVALRGARHDGHAFIESAVQQGARAVIAESWPDGVDPKFESRPNVVLVPNTRRALALAAANLYGQPSRDMVVAGVTGTNGKTTVVQLLESILLHAGKKTGSVGTLGSRFEGAQRDTGHTTPEPVALQKNLAKMLAAGVTHVVMEVSSHALDQHRVTGVHFKVAGFTNLSQDHLDYHETMEKYFEAKSLLFSRCLERSQARGRMAVVNVDDPKGEAMIEAWGGKSLRVSAEGNREADLWVRDSTCSLDGIRMAIETSKGVMELESKLVGAHNLTNVLVAVGMAQAMGFSESRIRSGLEQLTAVPGRMEKVVTEDPRQVFVDYAHTPDALGRVLASLRPLVRGRIIVVFGCGGDRDAEKRPAMGRAVAEGADAAVLTSDNPRGEDPAQIAEQAAAGLREGGFRELEPEDRPDRAPEQAFQVELDRWEAIQLAVKWAGPDDVVLLAGKGHETRQELQDRTVPFDDRDAARRTLLGLPPAPEPPPVPGSGEVEVLQVVESVDIEPDIVGETHEEPSNPGGAEP